MTRRLHPLALAELVARNLVPVAGVLFFGWSPIKVLLLYPSTRC